MLTVDCESESVDFITAITNALDSFMNDRNYVNSRIVPVDYHIADTDLNWKFDLRQFVKKDSVCVR